MGKRADARLAKLLASELEKAGLTGSPMALAGSVASSMSGAQLPQLLGVNQGPNDFRQLARDPNTYGAALGPGYPFVPMPLDQLGPNGRTAPRKYQYDVADNLNINKKLAQWNILASAAVQCDLFARAIAIRTSDVTKMDWKWNVSKDAIETIMDDNNCGSSEASSIARKSNMAMIVKLSEFWENPYPQSDRGWNEWITEGLWQVLVYDGWAVHPAFNLGGEVIGLDTIDAATIKILLDNEGDFVRPPDPGFQQVLYGFPRGEFVASPNKDLPTFLNGEYGVSERDQLSYFVYQRRTNTPYGLSPVEQALQIANIYLERERWMLDEYKYGTAASVYMKTGASEITLENLAGYNRIFNDFVQGSSANRQQTVTLPPGFEPEFAPQITEKYKADYDEQLIKRVAAFFGVAPSQFGVVARAGLGGGKGAAEGEQDNAETISSKPMNNYLEECINSLSRRYLGASRAITFTLNEDEGSEDEVELSTATKNYVAGAIKTPNEVRQELGLSLSSAPEADELMVITATGPVYLSGTLDAQLNPPKPIIVQEPKNAKDSEEEINQEPAEPQSDDGQAKETLDVAPQTTAQKAALGEHPELEPIDAAELVAKELKAFNSFVTKRVKLKSWRDFNFEHAGLDKAGVLNFEGRQLVEGGLKTLTKRKAEDESHYKKLTAVAKGHSGFLRSAIVAGTSGVAAAITHALNDKTGNDVKEIARQAVAQNVTFDNTKAKAMLGNLYHDAAKVGTDAAAEATGSEAVESRSVVQLLAKSDITLKGIDDTAMGRISDTIASGLTNGDGYRAIGDAVNAIIDDPARADVIAITEGNRAMNASFIDQLQAAGETTFDWVNEANPCPECQGEIDDNPHEINDDAPPEHPNCRCVAVMAQN